MRRKTFVIFAIFRTSLVVHVVVPAYAVEMLVICRTPR